MSATQYCGHPMSETVTADEGTSYCRECDEAGKPKRERPHRWLEPCRWKPGHKHLWQMGKCPSCGVYETAILVSEKAHYHREECDGCEAYRDHQA